jgi:hypothetical protein
MKITIDIDCTPEEARIFLGLPDVQPMQKAVMAEIEERVRQALLATDPETLIKTWLPVGMQGLEQMQRMFWSHLAGAAEAAGKGKAGKE